MFNRGAHFTLIKDIKILSSSSTNFITETRVLKTMSLIKIKQFPLSLHWLENVGKQRWAVKFYCFSWLEKLQPEMLEPDMKNGVF